MRSITGSRVAPIPAGQPAVRIPGQLGPGRFGSGKLGTETKTAPETGAVFTTGIGAAYLPPEGNE